MSSDSNAAGQQLAAAAAAAAAQSNSPQQQATQPAAPSQPANSTPVSSDSSKCMWEGCNDRFNGPEALYVSEKLLAELSILSESQED